MSSQRTGVAGAHDESVPRLSGVSFDREWLSVEWSDGQSARFPTFWLRDNIPSGRHQTQGQRVFDIIEVPDDTGIKAASSADDGIKICFEPEQLEAVFDPAWLRSHAPHEPDAPPMEGQGQVWGREFSGLLPRESYPHLRDNEASTLR